METVLKIEGICFLNVGFLERFATMCCICALQNTGVAIGKMKSSDAIRRFTGGNFGC